MVDEMLRQFKLPDLGEGLREATLVGWSVKEGDVIKADQPVAEVETDKATTPLPSPFGGRVVKLHGNAGDVIKVGAVLVEIEADGVTAPVKPTPSAAAPAALPPAAKVQPAKATAKAAAAPPAGARQATGPVLAAPATRRLAREKGVDLRTIAGTGPGGRITPDDVEAAAGGKRSAPRAAPLAAELVESIGAAALAGPSARPELPDFSRLGPIRREKASPIRKRIAQRMVLSQAICATVTHADEADITELHEQRLAAKELAESAGYKLTLLPLIVKACVSALKEFPAFNSSYDDERGEVVYKDYYNIGIAVDSPQGLLVPVLKNADRKPARALAVEIMGLADATRTGKITADELRGGTFTITNIGAIGGLGFTPVINWPEVAILGVGRTQERLARNKDGEIVTRRLLPLCLSFDHRIVDGADAARFTNHIKFLLENPLLLLAEI
jgi:pyruvate dehydrogenase E2 component (dihydrolipoamide acetyltransferase)